jgi:sec-independent protein translocase protein TatC
VPPSPLGGLGELLAALRARLRVAIATLALLFVAAFALAEPLAALLARPLLEAWGRRAASEGLGPASLHFRSLLEPLWTFMGLAFWTALVLGSPVLFYQLWRVVAPRLPPERRRLGVPFAACTGACFIGGALFGYVVVLPMAYDVLLSHAATNLASIHAATRVVGEVALKPALGIESYLQLTIRFLVAFGVVFELPVLIALLAWLGVVHPRGLWRFNRWAIVLAFIVAAVLTPGPDVVSQIAMALPLVLLYQLSIGIAWLIARRTAPVRTRSDHPPRASA